jgi:hypothetical protein
MALDRVIRSRFVATLPRNLSVLVVVYFLASLAHFTHNAEYIAFYPGMPAGLTRETVYLVWLGVTSIGLVALVLYGFGACTAALGLLGVYGAFGLDGLAHYTLALCSEHTLLANVTIWSEAITGLTLLVVSSLVVGRRAFPTQRGRNG